MALRLWPEINSHLLRFEMHVARSRTGAKCNGRSKAQ